MELAGGRVSTGTIGTAVVVVAVVALGIFTDINLPSVIVNGVQIGAVYALVSLGIALVYKSTRVLNFAQGELGTAPAWLVLMLLVGFDTGAELNADEVTLLGMIGATLAAVVFGVVLAILINVLVIKRLAQSSPVTSLVATAGVTVFLTAGQLIIFKARTRTFPRFVEGAPTGFELGPMCISTTQNGECLGNEGSLALGGVPISWHTIIILIVLVAAAGGLAIFFRTPPGVALLATAQDPFAAEIYGISPGGMSALAWGLAGALGALAGVLGAGVFSSSFAPGLMTTTFLIPGLTAAVLGGITSMPGAVVGGLLLGLTVALASEATVKFDLTISGPPQLATFVVLLLILLFRPRGLLGKEA